MTDGRTPSSSPGGPSHPRRDDARWAATVAVLFFCLVGIGLITHEMWRDEWQAWMLARASSSLGELFNHLRGEGHPAGWYLVLFALSRFTRDAAAMQVLHLFIATGAVYLLARYAPLPRGLKALIAFGYFFVYEYGVISRAYSLGVLALFAFCALYPVRRRHPVLIVLTLVLLASTSIYGVILALAATATLGAEIIAVRVRHRSLKIPRLSVALGGVAIVAIIAIFVLVLMRPSEIFFARSPSNTVPGLARQDLLPLIRIWESYVPIPRISAETVWDTQLIPRANVGVVILLLGLSVSILAAATLLFSRKPLVLCFYLLGTAGLLLFSHLVFAGHLRHDGHLFILFVACLWLTALPSPEARLPERLRRLTALDAWPAKAFLLTLFLAQLLSAGVLYAVDLRKPFSPAEQVAQYLRSEGLDHYPIAVSRSPEVSPIAGALDRSFFHIDPAREWTFIPWRQLGANAPMARRMEILRDFMETAGPEVIVITCYPVDLWDPDFQAEELRRFDLAQAPLEEYYVYRVTRSERTLAEGN